MKLPSGKEITDKVLQDIVDGWAKIAFQDEHVSDSEGAIAEELKEGSYSTEGESYDEADRAKIIKAVEEVVVDIVIKLEEEYGKLSEEHIAGKHWE